MRERKIRKSGTLYDYSKIGSTTGGCTLVIAMMDVFGSGDLPNPPEGPFYHTDFASFRDLVLYAGRIEISCVVLQHSAGYLVGGEAFPFCVFIEHLQRRMSNSCVTNTDNNLGLDGSIAILIMSTESYENRMIPPGLSPAFSSVLGRPNLLDASHTTSAGHTTG